MTSPFGRISVKSNRLVLVEGEDERNLLTKMLAEWNIQGIQTIPVGGKDNFRAGLEQVMESARATETGLLAIGVLRDADEYPDRAFQSVAGSVRSQGLNTPSSHSVVAQGQPSTGIFILPDGTNPGAIEDLCWRSVEDTATAQCCSNYLACLEVSNALLSPNVGKTLVHAYLASQQDPSARVGEGALQGCWPLDHPAFEPLKDFLHHLVTI